MFAMQTLTFKVVGQSLANTNSKIKLIAGSSNYVQLRFDISGREWQGCKIVAQFNDTDAVPVFNKTCSVPSDYLSRRIFKVRLIGARSHSDYRIVTNFVYVELEA